SAGYKEFNGDVNIPSTINSLPVVSIGSSAFYLHQRMTSVVIQNGVTDIGATAFQSCSKLAHVEIPDSVTSIGFGAFSGCHDLTAINVPKGVVGIGQVAFSSCINLAAINVDPANPKYSSVDGVLFNKDKTSLIECPGGKAGAYTIPDSVTTIEDNAFSELRYLTSVAIPDHVTTIEW